MTAGRQPFAAVATAAGTVAALVVAGVLAQFRTGTGSANVALALAVVVVAAAMCGRIPGAATAVTAALGYNFFHTQPYNSLRVDTARDMVTIALLVVIGLVVSELGAWRRRTRSASQRQHVSARSLESIAALVANGAGVDVVWDQARTALVDSMHLADCRFEPGQHPSATVLERSGALVAPTMHFGIGGFKLPDEGVAIPVVAQGAVLGHIVLEPGADSISTLDARRAAVGIADLFAVASSASASGPVTISGTRPG